METKSSLNFGKTFVIGLGFFTTAISWSLYNAYIPIFLRKFISSATLIGLVMTFDNWAAIIIQPWIGALSDRTKTSLGKRMPYIALGIPLGAALFAILPFIALREPAQEILRTIPLIGEVRIAGGLLPIVLIIMAFNIAMALYRAPVVALMPDVIPSVHRSKANGIINLMGGVGSILAYLVGSFLYDIGVTLPFVCTAVVMVLALVILLIFVYEPESRRGIRAGLIDDAGSAASEKENGEVKKPGIIRSAKEIFREKEWSVLFILLAIFFWFLAFNSMETWFTTYGVEVLKIKESAAARILTSVSLFFVIFALPAGFIGSRVGRKRTILIGIALFAAVSFAIIFTRSIPVLYGFFALAGIAWALINVNSITIVWELASKSRLGTYTGLYYFFSALAQILAPPVAGFLMDRTSARSLFPFSTICFVLSLVMMFGVRKGEVKKAVHPK
jgi:MFS family permease